MSMAMTDCVLTKNEMPVFRPFPLESPFSGLTSGINNQKKKKRERGMVGWHKLPSTKRKKKREREFGSGPVRSPLSQTEHYGSSFTLGLLLY